MRAVEVADSHSQQHTAPRARTQISRVYPHCVCACSLKHFVTHLVNRIIVCVQICSTFGPPAGLIITNNTNLLAEFISEMLGNCADYETIHTARFENSTARENENPRQHTPA